MPDLYTAVPVPSDHSIPLTPPSGGSVVTNFGPGTVFYKSTPDVSSATFDGSIVVGAYTTLTSSAYLRASQPSSVRISDSAPQLTTAEMPNALTAGTTGALAGRKFCVLGHSEAEPYGPKHGYTWPFKVAHTIGAEEINFSRSGAILAMNDENNNPNNSGGYATIGNAVVPYLPYATLSPVAGGYIRQARNEQTIENATYLSTAAYVPFADIYAIWHGANDLLWCWNNTTTAMQIYQGAQEAMIARCRAGAYFNDDSFAIAYGGTWTAVNWFSQPGVLTRGSTHFSTQVGATITFTVPVSYDGGEIAFYFLAGGGVSGNAPTGGLITFTSGGTTLGTLDMSNSVVQRAPFPTSHTNSHACCVFRCKLPVTATTQTIVATITSISGQVPITNTPTFSNITTVLFDGVTIEATQPPRVFLLTFPHLPGGFNKAGAPNPTLTNADFDALNNTTKLAIQSPYWTDGNVIICDVQQFFTSLGADVTPYGAPKSVWFYDGAHLNEYGHDVLSQFVLNTISAGPSPIVNAASAAPHWHQVGAFTVTGSGPSASGTATLSGTLSTAGSLTSLPVTALGATIPSGSTVTLVSGANNQQFLTSATANSGATSIPVFTETAQFAFPNTSVVTWHQSPQQFGHAPAYASGWAGAPSGSGQTQKFGAEFSKDVGGRVSLRGRVSNAAPVANTPIFQLPVFCRPAEDTDVFVVATSAGTGTVEVDSEGNVLYLSGTTTSWMSLAGIQFIADGGSTV